jgi:Fe-S oxidoreductase
MECFKCVDNCCPEGLDPLLVNEIIKWEYRRNHVIETSYVDPKDSAVAQRVLASTQVSPEEYKRIFTATDKGTARYVFFPGCNVYFQPEKVLTALDIMGLITEDYAFVPGLDFCCGEVHLFSGAIERADKTSEELINTLSSYDPDTVILWCPTCHCRFEKTISPAREIPFKIRSFPQFIAENMDKLPLRNHLDRTVTLHEACKSAFTGVDLTGPRDVLKKIPGVRFIEMPRHAKNTVCCGSGAVVFFPKSFEAVRDERLAEAAQTNADSVVDICHFCHQVFAGEEPKYSYTSVNYVTLLAEAIGIQREDKLKKYIQLGDLDRVLEEAKEFVEKSPYSHDTIMEALHKLLE